ncbi:YlbL family protein [Tomitella biformata]|uniref:YlbL family protein n=1 Tax=Tomitella biformata TaxID=630403 RepID=UPI0004B2E15A|nr:PDZ domain-containing protein [Tomitella biformata]
MAALLAPVVALLIAGFTVVVPFVAMGPGPTVNTLGDTEIAVDVDGEQQTQTVPVVDVTGAPVDPTAGNLNMTTVAVRDQLTLFEAIGLWASGDNGIVPRDEVYQPGKSKDEIQQENSADFQSSETSAELAALRFLDKPFALAPAVGQVVAGGPADGTLEPDDVLLRIGGVEVADAAAAKAAIGAKQPGDNVEIEIRRGADVQTKTVELGKSGEGDDQTAVLGILLSEVPVSDVDVTFNLAGIGGPSAGLMFSLALVDKLSPGELNGGKFVAGTGTIDENGQVGPIGGITYKMAAAQAAGATIFLVPAANCAEAARHVPDGLDLVKVESLASAVSGLAAVATADGQAPSC